MGCPIWTVDAWTIGRFQRTLLLMFVVGIQGFAGDEAERAAAIAAAAGLSLYEGRARAKGPGPRLVASFGARADADRVATALAAYEPIVLGPTDIVVEAQRALVRSFVLGPQTLEVTLRDGRALATPYGSIELLLRGTRIRQEQHTEVKHETSLKVGRTLLTGIPTFARERKETTVNQEVREGFVHLQAGGLPELTFRETVVLYESLGAAMQPTRAANFVRLVTELRGRASQARYDERLLTRAGQVQLLGGVLAPEPFLDVATTLLAQSLRADAGPYR